MPDIYLLIDGKQEGPYTEEATRQSLAEGLIPSDLPAWREGLADWVNVGDLAGPPPLFYPSDQNKAAASVDPSDIPAESLAESVRLIQTTRKLPYWYLAGGGLIAAGIIIFVIVLRGNLVHARPTGISSSLASTQKQTSSTEPEPKSGESDNQSNEDNSISTGDAKQWLTQKIEAFGGDVCTWYTDNLTIEESYHYVSFDGDILSIMVQLKYSNGNYQSYTEKINIAAVKPGSFTYNRTDTSSMTSFTEDPSVFYVIHFEGSGEEPVKYSDNPSFQNFQFEIKNEQIAKRIVNALNFLTKNTKAEPF